jgi:tetratricopeptide (TPR) repeat protein
LEKIVAEFPYFQSARALRLKGFYNQDSFRYNYDLKVTAAHTTDRSVLFDFITSNSFKTIDTSVYQTRLAEIKEIEVLESEVISEKKIQQFETNTLEQSLLTSIKEATPALKEDITTPNEANIIRATEKLAIGKPIGFSAEEKHSFQEWLQLSKIQPIDRNESEIELNKKKKSELIDKFIEANPKIPPLKQELPVQIIPVDFAKDSSYLMTETLAKVYLEQRKYQKAIQAYEILILKYPEKSSLFADRILDIKILQQNNK